MTKPIDRNPYGLPQWKHPDNYGGFSPDEDFLVFTRNRDSDLLGNTNFETIQARLQETEAGLPKPPKGSSPFVYTFTARNWGRGWVEHLLVGLDSPDEIQREVYEIHAALSQYPVFDDRAYSEAENEATLEYWGRMCTDRRIELCYEYGVSIFAARREWIPENLYDQVRAWATE